MDGSRHVIPPTDGTDTPPVDVYEVPPPRVSIPPIAQAPPEGPPAPNPVADRVLLMLATLAVAVMLILTVVTAYLAITRPEGASELGGIINTQLSVIVGAVLGYAARMTGTRERPSRP